MKPTIVIIDDDVHALRFEKAALEDAGDDVVTGSDGQMALHLAKTNHPQLMVMDVNMPMTSGLKALEFLRKSSDTKDIPIIFLTGASSATVYPTIEQEPRVAFLKKPV